MILDILFFYTREVWDKCSALCSRSLEVRMQNLRPQLSVARCFSFLAIYTPPPVLSISIRIRITYLGPRMTSWIYPNINQV